MEKPVIIFGAKGIAQAALEIFQQNGVVVYGLLDDDETLHGTEIHDIPILGSTEDHGFLKLIGQKCEAFVSSDENSEREEQVEYLTNQRKVMPTNAVHPGSQIAGSANIGHGNFINGGAIIGSGSTIGQHCLIHSGAIIEHDVTLEDFVQIGAGARINPSVKIAEQTFIGSGAIIVAGVSVGKNARIGAGSVVISDVGENETVFGNPATKMDT